MAKVVEPHTWESCTFRQFTEGMGKGSRCPWTAVDMTKYNGTNNQRYAKQVCIGFLLLPKASNKNA